MRLSFLLTERCNAQCTHCTTDSHPEGRADLSADEVCRLMDEAAALREPGDPLLFCLSGGEPFLDLPRLRRVVAHGAGLGAEVTCTTNGSWAASDAKAEALMRELRDAGLAAVGVSTSRWHRRWVKPDRVRRALRAAKAAGLKTLLKCAVTRGDEAEGWATALAQELEPDVVEVFPVLPYLRSGARLDESDYPRTPGLPEGPCPGALLSIREDGTAYTCCNPGGFAPLLSLGNARAQPLAELVEAHRVSGLQQILRTDGPVHFARAAQAAGLGAELRPAYGGVCDLCGHIASNPALAGVARRCAEDLERNQLEDLFRRMTATPRPARRAAPHHPEGAPR